MVVCEKCPCDTLKGVQESIKTHEKSLAKGDIQFAVINTKLNIVLGVMATIGIALCGIILKMMFGV